MNVLVLTNNQKVKDELDTENTEVMFIEELPALLDRCFSMVSEGWKLLVDPMAGYLSRPNPYHSIPMTKRPEEQLLPEHKSKEIMAIDTLMSHYWLEKEQYLFHSSSDEHLKDHAEVDRSIVMRSLQSLKNQPQEDFCPGTHIINWYSPKLY